MKSIPGLLSYLAKQHVFDRLVDHCKKGNIPMSKGGVFARLDKLLKAYTTKTTNFKRNGIPSKSFLDMINTTFIVWTKKSKDEMKDCLVRIFFLLNKKYKKI